MSLNDNWTSQAQHELDKIEIPQNSLNQAVMQGARKAKQRRTTLRVAWPTLVAAALIFLFVTSIRVSPAFASAVSQLPGMERIVEYVQGEDDRGLLSAIQNDYYQALGISQEVNYKTLTIDGVIPDEQGMVVFYTIESAEGVEFRGEALKIYAEGQNLPSSYTYNNPDAQKAGRFEDTVHFHYEDPVDVTMRNYTFEVQLKDAKETTFSIDFELPKAMKPSKVYTLNQDIKIDGNTLHFKEAIVSPRKVGVTISYDADNPDSIYFIEKMELRDQKGEVWDTIQNGLSGTFNEEMTERTYYFQSSYFDEPEQLTLFIDRIQALPKGEDFMIINFEERQVIYTPPYADFHVELIGDNALSFTLKQINETFSHGMVGTAVDKSQQQVSIKSEAFATYDGRHHIDVQFDTTTFDGETRIEFGSYPNYLDGSAEIQIIK